MILVLSSFLIAESFEEHQKRQSLELANYKKSNNEDFAKWNNKRDNAIRQWQSEFEKYNNSGLRRLKVYKSNNVVSKYDINYTNSTVNVSVIANEKTKDEAIKSVIKVVNDTYKTALLKSDLTIKKYVKKKHLNKFIKAKEIIKNILIKKTDKGYIGEYNQSKSLNKLLPSVLKKNKPKKKKYNKKYTSLIVDLRGLRYKACLVPVIQNSKKEQLYGPKLVEKDIAINGMAIWKNSIKSAKSSKIAGKNPLIVKADSIKKRRIIVVKGQDSKQLKTMAGSKIIRECKIIIVVD